MNADAPALGVEGRGAVVAAWREVRPHMTSPRWTIGAAVRAAGADWGAAESLAPSDDATSPPAVLSAAATTRLLWQPAQGGALVTRRLGP